MVIFLTQRSWSIPVLISTKLPVEHLVSTMPIQVTKLVAPAAGRRGCCRCHWSARDSASNFSAYAYSSSLAFAQVTFETSSTDPDPVLFRQDAYLEVTICAWGRRETFNLSDICDHESLMPRDHLLDVSDAQLSKAWENLKLELDDDIAPPEIP